MNKFELFFLDNSFSWFLSKLIPYVIFIVIGLVLMILFRKKFKHSNKVIRSLFSILILIIPFICYFIIQPIYEGDFSNTNKEYNLEAKYSELKPNKLIVISIANCPYCYDAMGQLKKMRSRSPNLEIEYIVCSQDSSSIDWYKSNADSEIDVRLASNSDALVELAEGRFPTFVLLEDKNILTWSNDNFGVSAMDLIEAKFRK